MKWLSTVTTKARKRKRENNEAESNEGRGRGTYILIGYSKDNEAESNEGRRYESFPFAYSSLYSSPAPNWRTTESTHTRRTHTHAGGLPPTTD
jgi:hypothetical protein